MKFKYSAFTENTAEAREWLEKLGRTKMETKLQKARFIMCSSNWYAEVDNPNTPPIVVDCRNNLPLFKAITAVREDSDYMQWFYKETLDENDKPYIKWILNDENCEYDVNSIIEGLCFFYEWNKATLEELINHFKI